MDFLYLKAKKNLNKGNKEVRVNAEEFMTLFNNDEAVLVDVRMSFEKKVWNFNYNGLSDTKPLTFCSNVSSNTRV